MLRRRHHRVVDFLDDSASMRASVMMLLLDNVVFMAVMEWRHIAKEAQAIRRPRTWLMLNLCLICSTTRSRPLWPSQLGAEMQQLNQTGNVRKPRPEDGDTSVKLLHAVKQKNLNVLEGRQSLFGAMRAASVGFDWMLSLAWARLCRAGTVHNRQRQERFCRN